MQRRFYYCMKFLTPAVVFFLAGFFAFVDVVSLLPLESGILNTAQWFRVHHAYAAGEGDGRAVYGEGSVATPRTRTWTATTASWENPESSAALAGATIRHVIVKAAPTRNEMLVGVQTTGGTLYVERWNGTTWSNEWSVTVGDGNLPRFDIAYERGSGRALVVYSTNTPSANEIAYRTWDGSSWGAVANYDAVRTSGAVHAVALATAAGSSNAIAMVWADANLDLSANYWDGTNSVWKGEPVSPLSTGVDTRGGASTLTGWSFDLDFEQQSGELLVVWGNAAATDISHITRSTGATGTWGTVTTATAFAEQSDDLELAADPNSDYMILVHTGSDSGNDMEMGVWNGSSFPTTLDTSPPFAAGSIVADLSVDTTGAGTSGNAAGWLTSGGATRGVVTYDDVNSAGVDWFSYNKTTNTWTLESDCTTLCNSKPASGDDKLHRIRQNPFNDAELTALFVDNARDLFIKRLTFNGTAFTWSSNEPGGAALETSVSSIVGFSSDFAYDRYIAGVTTIADGTNPSNASLSPGGSVTDLDVFTLATSAGTDTVTGVTVTLSPAGAFNNIGQVDITDNSNVSRCTAITNPSSNTISFNACSLNGGIPVTTNAATYKVRITPKSHPSMPAVPGASYDVAGTVTSFTSGNTQLGTDAGSATITVDNLSPSGATNVSGTAGVGTVTLNWTTGPTAVNATLVQEADSYDDSGNRFSSVALSFTVPTTSGNAIFVSVGHDPSDELSPLTGVSDNKGNTFTRVAYLNDPNSGYQFTELWYALNITGGSSHQITVSNGASSMGYTRIIIEEYGGIATIGALDQYAAQLQYQPGASTDVIISGNTPTTIQGTDLVYGLSQDGLVFCNTDNFSPGTGFALHTTGSTKCMRVESKSVSAPGIQAATFTNAAGATGSYATIVAAFKRASDFERSIVLRWVGASPGAEVPAEGVDYTNGNTIGAATVVCVRTSDAPGAPVSGVDGGGSGGCSATALTNGQTYTYKVFQKDTSGNYDAGTLIGAFTLSGGGLPVSGILTSGVFDTTGDTHGAAFNSILWKGTTIGTGAVRFQLAAADAPTGPWSYYGNSGSGCGTLDWFNPGAFDVPVELKGSGCSVYFNNKRYYRYKIQICSAANCTDAGSMSPVVTSVMVNWAP